MNQQYGDFRFQCGNLALLYLGLQCRNLVLLCNYLGLKCNYLGL
eukprot:gene18409-13237_t